jgi:neocarzinostatin family protein
VGRRFTVLLAAFVALAGAALAGCVPPGGPGSPLTTVSPSTGLADGQLVTVTGTHFPANTDVVVVQCATGAPTPDNCDLNTVQFLVTDGSGRVQTQFLVARKLLTGIGDEFDCAVVGSCEMAVSDLDVITFDTAPISFNPNLPLAPPLRFTATVANDGLVLEHDGIAILHGKLTCNRGAFVDLEGRLSQAFGRFLFRSDFSVVKTCPGAGTFDYAFLVEPDNGLFAAGAASVRFSAFGFANDSSSQQAEVTQPVTLTAVTGSSPAAQAAATAPTQAYSSTSAVVAQVRSDRTARSGTHW